MLIEVHREYKFFLTLEMQEQDEDWFNDIDEKMMSFKNKIHSWIGMQNMKEKNDFHPNQEV